MPTHHQHPQAQAAAIPQGLISEFNREMFRLLRTIRSEAHYPAPYFAKMLHERGPMDTAIHLIRSMKASDGFTNLWERDCLHLSVEAFVLEPRWRDLFAAADLEAARRRLRLYGYIVED
jgi:hypothetical protein